MIRYTLLTLALFSFSGISYSDDNTLPETILCRSQGSSTSVKKFSISKLGTKTTYLKIDNRVFRNDGSSYTKQGVSQKYDFYF